MTEALLLLPALALTLACAVFVAAEFSLAPVGRRELERAAETGQRGVERALRAVRRLTVRLSGRPARHHRHLLDDRYARRARPCHGAPGRRSGAMTALQLVASAATE
ncbi:hypothetical protein J116_003390 [Streptomyces thermolilacinus SPC6]|uniref:CNNM transmembrane domain-containing protein n=1 Tax=Streptomyces thermolilacinus SPC6 TaxID=1306406 RepID=A0A1D3DMV3_9ACTN|nr:hypothetical protein J116_003390 [Streptomyces thermolilacinus SPC6]